MPKLADHLSHLLDVLERRYERGIDDSRPRVPTGLEALNQLVGGVGPGGWLIRGGPGLGTTSLVVYFVLCVAARRERPVVQLVTSDLSPHELTLRLVAVAGNLPLDQLRSEHLAALEWKRVSFAMSALSGADVRIVDARGWSQSELEMWCVDERPARTSPSWLVIDRLDQLSHPGVISLPRLERLSGRQVVATTRYVLEDTSAAPLVTTLQLDELGHRELAVDRPKQGAVFDRPIGLSIHGSTLQVRDHAAPRPGPGQLRLDGLAGPTPGRADGPYRRTKRQGGIIRPSPVIYDY